MRNMKVNMHYRTNAQTFTWRRDTNKKKRFAYFLNCSQRNFGINVNTLYLAVLILLEQKFPVDTGSLMYTILRGFSSSMEQPPLQKQNLYFSLSLKLREGISGGSIVEYVGFEASPNNGISVYLYTTKKHIIILCIHTYRNLQSLHLKQLNYPFPSFSP